MNPHGWNSLNLFRAQTLALSDGPPKPVDAIFLHTRAKGDDDQLFEIAAKALRTGLARYVITNGSDGQSHRRGPGSGWAGKDAWVKALRKLGIRETAILLCQPALDTREENTQFLETAVSHGFKRVAILAQPHQVLRAMLGLLKEMDLQKHYLQVYVMTPQSCPWWRKVYGSQGLHLKPRFEHIEDEASRIEKYATKGDLATPSEYFAYLKHRDQVK
jgi:hypothetical protein